MAYLTFKAQDYFNFKGQAQNLKFMKGREKNLAVIPQLPCSHRSDTPCRTLTQLFYDPSMI